MQKPSIPKGTRDFLPLEMERREYILNLIKGVFHKFGFLQIETPAMENLSTLLGKYGEEGDRLLFKILNSGDFTKGVDMNESNTNKLATQICEKGLRYDLTVPFARFVVQHRNELTFPFRRFQCQPVWRADRPQRGRYREFYQCDADIIGSDSLINEVELINLIDEVFQRLGIRVSIRLNNRKILAGIAELIGEAEKIIDITVAIDKLDKIGLDKVKQELLEKGISQTSIDRLEPILLLEGTNAEKLAKLKEVFSEVAIGQKGVEELEEVLSYIGELKADLELDLTLARGLNYYTGAIIEVKALDVQIGSISGGGRYDNLTGVFGLDGMSGVGVSFGVDRIYDVMEELGIFPEASGASTKILFIALDQAAVRYSLPVLHEIRANGISAEIYPDHQAKMRKQMQYANDKQVKFVAIVGEEEMKQSALMLKNMATGEQKLVHKSEILENIK